MNWKGCGSKRSWPNLSIILKFSGWTGENHEKPQLLQLVSGPRSEPRISLISRNAIHLTAKLRLSFANQSM
jgi:hypothetical protein